MRNDAEVRRWLVESGKNVEENEKRVRRGFWPKLERFAARLPFAGELVAAWYAAFDRATPLRVRGILLAALAYFVLPFDVVPDFFPGLGFTDDLTVLVTAYTMIRAHIRPEHRERAKQRLRGVGRENP